MIYKIPTTGMRAIIRTVAAGLLAMAATTGMSADKNGGLTPELLQRLRSGMENTAGTRALRNAMSQTDINTLARNAENAGAVDQTFSDRVESKGITNQRSSGRCWLFTGLNVIRARMMERNGLGKLELSQNYIRQGIPLSFWGCMPSLYSRLRRRWPKR